MHINSFKKPESAPAGGARCLRACGLITVMFARSLRHHRCRWRDRLGRWDRSLPTAAPPAAGPRPSARLQGRRGTVGITPLDGSGLPFFLARGAALTWVPVQLHGGGRVRDPWCRRRRRGRARGTELRGREASCVRLHEGALLLALEFEGETDARLLRRLLHHLVRTLVLKACHVSLQRWRGERGPRARRGRPLSSHRVRCAAVILAIGVAVPPSSRDRAGHTVSVARAGHRERRELRRRAQRPRTRCPIDAGGAACDRCVGGGAARGRGVCGSGARGTGAPRNRAYPSEEACPWNEPREAGPGSAGAAGPSDCTWPIATGHPSCGQAWPVGGAVARFSVSLPFSPGDSAHE